MSGPTYRSDIDGLRAVAVLSVILFHLGVPFISGGFVGVDIFFVISGFLITSIVARDLVQEKFSLSHFYERRILRIFPALFAMLGVSTIAGYFLLFPPDLKYFGQVLSAAGIFGSNIIFWKESGYFEADSFTIPLLHTWSLAVEEQFYIFFPLLLMAVHKFAPRLFKPAIVVCFLISFIAAAVAAQMGMTAVLFYLLPTRAWELLVGSILALSLFPAPNRNLSQVASIIGLGLIGYAVFFFHEDMVFPGPAALVPTLGAALLIYSGKGIGNSLLSLRPVVFTGKISYSLYLWHWPLIVFVKYASPVEISGYMSAILLILLFGVSFLSWKFIEQPFRYQTAFSRSRVFAIAFAVSIVFIIVGVVISKKQGFPNRFSAEIQNLYSVVDTGIELPTENFTTNKNEAVGILGYPEAKPSFLVWGDSHAGAATPGIDAIAKEKAIKGYFLNLHSCPPSAIDLPKYVASDECNIFNRRVMAFLKARPEIKNVILIGHWSMHERRIAREYRLRHVSSPTVLHDTLDTLFTQLEKEGRHVSLLIDPPHAPMENVPLYMARANFYGADMNLHFDLTDQKKRQEGMTLILDDLKTKHDFLIVDPAPVFCPNGICSISKGSNPFFTDDNHLTRWASVHFKAIYAPFFEKRSGK